MIRLGGHWAAYGEWACFPGTRLCRRGAMPRPARRESLMPGGGFVFNQVHSVMADVPPENIVAMLDAAFEFGEY